MNADDTFIAIDNDKQGVPVTIYWAEKIDGSIVVPFFLRGLAQLIEQGFSGSRLFGTNQSKAVYAVINNDTVVGSIVYETQQDIYKTAWIIYTGVDDNYRRRGIYMILHRHFENVLKNEGTRRSASNIHSDNLVVQAGCRAYGAKPALLDEAARKQNLPYIRMEKKVPLLYRE